MSGGVGRNIDQIREHIASSTHCSLDHEDSVAVLAALDAAEAERERLRAQVVRLRHELSEIGVYARVAPVDKVQLFHMLASIADTCEQALEENPPGGREGEGA